MGEADLMFAAQLLLASVTVGDPDIRLMTTQNFLGDAARPAWGDPVQDRILRESKARRQWKERQRCSRHIVSH